MTDFVPFFLLRSLDQESNNFLAPVLSKGGVVVYASATASSALAYAQWAVWPKGHLILKQNCQAVDNFVSRSTDL